VAAAVGHIQATQPKVQVELVAVEIQEQVLAVQPKMEVPILVVVPVGLVM
jgi:hypothetical protein